MCYSAINARRGGTEYLKGETGMKKIICVLLTLSLLLLSAAPAYASGETPEVRSDSFGAYKHVFIIGVDGAGRFFRDVDTPNFDRIFQNGVIDYTARAEMITVSAQNWGSILTGVSYLKHGLTNTITGEVERSSNTRYPSIFTYARQAFPDAVLAGFGNWSNINYGIIENDINVYKASATGDDNVTQMICDYLDAGNAPTLLFTQLDDVDHVGHDKGSKAAEYFEQIGIADGYIGRIYDAVERNGMLEDSLFIVVADHGHMIAGGHGGLTMRETQVTLAMSGKTVVSGGELDDDARNRDVAAIALYALGISRPDHMSARIPANAFENTAGEKRSFMADPWDTILSSIAWAITCCTALI